jgi:hypothetical protein
VNVNYYNVEAVEITPELARKWLGQNTHNRNVRQRVVLAYAADMVAGNWQWNGESIKFAIDGTLLDGQHRLAAIIESGMTITMLVVRGLPSEAQETVDGGAKRKFSDVLQLRGERSPVLLAAITRRVTAWEAGGRGIGRNIKYAPTTAQLQQTLEKYPWLRDVTLISNRISAHCGLPGSIIGLGWWLFSQLSAEDTDFFFGRLADFQDLSRTDPIYQLRKSSDASKSVRGSRSETYLTAIMIKAWNAYRDGVQVSLLTYRPGGSRPESFPEPR